MSANLHSSDFSRLTAAWLDGTATADEIEKLRGLIAMDPDCARRFAVAARFEPLPPAGPEEHASIPGAIVLDELPGGQIHKASHHPQNSPAVPPHSGAPTPKPAMWSRVSLHLAGLAAALALVAAFFWQSAAGPGAVGSNVSAEPEAKRNAAHSPRNESQFRPGPSVAPVAPQFTDVNTAPPTEVPLRDRLDQFFLTGVSLNRVPLNQAVGMLQGQLRELNVLHAEVLDRLRITVPANAANRPVTFYSGSIAFLKAVQAVAALAGCDVISDETTLALVLNRETYPQVAERRDLRQLLKAALRPDGSDPADDPRRIAGLVADAVALGLPLDATQTLEAQTFVPVTRGQWAALAALVSGRDQLSQMDSPNFELYVTSGLTDAAGGQALNEETVEKLRGHFRESGKEPVAVVAPDRASDPRETAGSSVPVLSMRPIGETTQITVNLPISNQDQLPADALPQDAAVTTFQGTLLPGEGLTIPLTLNNNGIAGTTTVKPSLFRGLTFLPLPTRAGAPAPAAISMSQLYISTGSAGSVVNSGGAGSRLQIFRSSPTGYDSRITLDILSGSNPVATPASP